MAITNVEQREIVEIPFTMPDGSILPHPALVISRNELQVDEDGMFYAVLISTKNYHPEYTIRIEDEWLNKPMGRQSYFITHLVNMFNGSGDRYLNHSNFTNLTNKNLLNNENCSSRNRLCRYEYRHFVGTEEPRNSC